VSSVIVSVKDHSMDKSTTTTYGQFTITTVELGYESLAWIVVIGLATLVLVGYLVLADRRRNRSKLDDRFQK
jgi:general stress protein CsbA